MNIHEVLKPIVFMTLLPDLHCSRSANHRKSALTAKRGRLQCECGWRIHPSVS